MTDRLFFFYSPTHCFLLRSDKDLKVIEIDGKGRTEWLGENLAALKEIIIKEKFKVVEFTKQ